LTVKRFAHKKVDSPFQTVPEELKGAQLLYAPLGKSNKPGTGYSFKVE